MAHQWYTGVNGTQIYLGFEDMAERVGFCLPHTLGQPQFKSEVFTLTLVPKRSLWSTMKRESKNMRELKELLAPKPVAETPLKPDLEFVDSTARDEITFFKPPYRAVFTFTLLVLLLLACMARWPYGFYTFLRFVVYASAVYVAVFASVMRNQFWLLDDGRAYNSFQSSGADLFAALGVGSD